MNEQCEHASCAEPRYALGFCKKHYDRHYYLQRRALRPPPPERSISGRTWSGAATKFLERLKDHVGDECLIWPFTVDRDGYPRFKRRVGAGYQRILVHRFACELRHGPPAGDGAKIHAAHLCGNSTCCNPSHLHWATPAENAVDGLRFGRVRWGESHYRAKLKAHEAVAIVQDPRALTVIAQEYGVTEVTIRDVKSGKNWAHITGVSPRAGSIAEALQKMEASAE